MFFSPLFLGENLFFSPPPTRKHGRHMNHRECGSHTTFAGGIHNTTIPIHTDTRTKLQRFRQLTAENSPLFAPRLLFRVNSQPTSILSLAPWCPFDHNFTHIALVSHIPHGGAACSALQCQIGTTLQRAKCE